MQPSPSLLTPSHVLRPSCVSSRPSSHSWNEIEVPADLSAAAGVTAGKHHTCALSVDAQAPVVCWGDNSKGQTMVPPGLKGVKAITAGMDFTCALTTSPEEPISCWGDNS